ncbi:MAG: hypothetical protein KGJ07_00585 [Patescibacteria group bacterium]|nr:hypothetical protein [Patescibacteria group bacterium]
MNLYLQNPNLYPEPSWSNYVIGGSVTENGKTQNVAVAAGANAQTPPPSVQDPNASKKPDAVLNQKAATLVSPSEIGTLETVEPKLVSSVPAIIPNVKAPTPPNPVEAIKPESVIPQAGIETPQSKGLSLGQADLSGQETAKPILKQNSTVTESSGIIEVTTPTKTATVIPTSAKEITQPTKTNTQNNFVSTNESLRESILQERENEPSLFSKLPSNYLQSLVGKGVLSTEDLIPIASTIEFETSSGQLAPAEKNNMITIEEPAPVSATKSTQSPVSVTNKTNQEPLSNQQILDIHNYVDQVSKTVSDAQAKGATSINIISNGKQIDSIPIKSAQSTKSVLFEAIPSLQKQYGDISLQYAEPTQSKVSKVPLSKDQVNQIHSYTESIVQTVQEAKASGAKSIYLVDEKGNRIDSLPVNDETTRLLFLAVPAVQKNVKGLSLEYTPSSDFPLGSGWSYSSAGIPYKESKTGTPIQTTVLGEFTKGIQAGTNDLINEGKGLVNFVISGGKNTTVSSGTPDIISSVLTSPIVETKNETTGKVSTSVSLKNAQTNLGNLEKSIEQNPAKEIGLTIPAVETIIGGALVGELPSLFKAGTSVLSKSTEVSEVGAGGVASSSLRTPTYRATNMFRTSIPNDVFDFDTAEGSNFKSTEINLGTGAGKTGGGFSSTTIDLGRGFGSTPPPSGSVSDFYKAISNLPKAPSKNAPLPSYQFSEPTASEGETVVKSGEQNLITKTETKQETVTEQITKDLQEQTKKAQKAVSKLYQTEEPKSTVKTTTKSGSLTDLANKEYLDTLTKRKQNLKALIGFSEDTQFINTEKVGTLTGIKTGKQTIFETPQKTDIFEIPKPEVITIPKQEEKITTDIIQIPKVDVITVPKVKPTTDIITIPKLTTTGIIDIPTPEITTTIPKLTPQQIIDIPTTTDIIQIPVNEGGGGKGGGLGGGDFFPLGGGGGGSESSKKRASELFADYDVSQDVLGLSKVGKVQYSKTPIIGQTSSKKARGNVDKLVEKMTGIKTKYNNSFGQRTKKKGKKRG